MNKKLYILHSKTAQQRLTAFALDHPHKKLPTTYRDRRHQDSNFQEHCTDPNLFWPGIPTKPILHSHSNCNNNVRQQHTSYSTYTNAQTTITFTVKRPTPRNTRKQNQCQETRDPESIRVPSIPHCLINQMQLWWRSATTLYNTLYKIARFLIQITPFNLLQNQPQRTQKKKYIFILTRETYVTNRRKFMKALGVDEDIMVPHLFNVLMDLTTPFWSTTAQPGSAAYPI